MTALAGRIALVTGIGAAFARAFAANGCNVVMNNVDDASTAAEQLNAAYRWRVGGRLTTQLLSS